MNGAAMAHPTKEETMTPKFNTGANTTIQTAESMSREFMARRIHEALCEDKWVALRDLVMTAEEVRACEASGLALADVGAAMFDLFGKLHG